MRGALEVLDDAQIAALVERHAHGDWGRVEGPVAAENELGIREGGRLLSVYPIDPLKHCDWFAGNCVWIITDIYRRMTRVLLPSEI